MRNRGTLLSPTLTLLLALALLPGCLVIDTGIASRRRTSNNCKIRVYFRSNMDINGTWDGTAAAGSNIWAIYTDGTGLTRLTNVQVGGGVFNSVLTLNYDVSKVFAPGTLNLDGTFASAANNFSNIWGVPTTGATSGISGGSLQGNSAGAGTINNVVLSPDGTKIIYDSLEHPNGTNAVVATRNVWIASADFSSRSPLTQNTTAGVSQAPKFSPDGTKVYFQSTMNLTGPYPTWNAAANTAPNLWVIDVGGTNLAPVSQFATATAAAQNLWFTPDGTKIYVTGNPPQDMAWATAGTTCRNLWVTSPDGVTRSPLTNYTAASCWAASPAVDVGGQYVYFVAQGNLDGSDGGVSTGSLNLWRMPVGGTTREALTRNTAASFAASSPTPLIDGEGMVLSLTNALTGTWDSGGATHARNLWYMKKDGTGLTPLTRNTNATFTVNLSQNNSSHYVCF